MAKTFINRGDLLKVLEHYNYKLPDSTAHMLGFYLNKKKPVDNNTDTKQADSLPLAEMDLESVRLNKASAQKALPFWQPVSLISDKIKQPQKIIPGEIKLPVRKAEILPDYHYLASFTELIPRIRELLSKTRSANTYDVPKIIKNLAKGKSLNRFPTKNRKGWGSQLYIIEDRSDHLAPYVRDQAMLQDSLQQFYPEDNFFPSVYMGHHIWPRVSFPDGKIEKLNPEYGDQLLVLGDLGCLANDNGQASQFWLTLGRKLNSKGGVLHALLPCHKAECHSSLLPYYKLLSWEHPAPCILTDQQLQHRGKKLLQHIALASRVEAGLLRDIRLLWGAENYPARLESWLWQHPQMKNSDILATAVHEDFQSEYQNSCLNNVQYRKKTITTIKQWMLYQPYELWLESVFKIADWEAQEDYCKNKQSLLTDKEQEDAIKLLNYLASAYAAEGLTCFSQKSWQWIAALEKKLSDSKQQNPQIEQACWTLNKAIQQINDGMGKLPEKEVTLYQLYHSNRKFLLSSVDKLLSSPMAAIQSQDGLIRLSAVSFWKNNTPPEWAVDWGEDDYGLWVDFNYKEVIQRLRWIEAGTFLMGSPEDEPGRTEAEGPQHSVTIAQGYWIFATPVTQALWQAVMGDNPSRFKSSNRPVENISWDDCQDFIKKINNSTPGLNLALPSEAQWEYACRAGTNSTLYTGEIEILGKRNAPALDNIAWYGGNSGQDFELDNGVDSSDWEEKQYNHKKAGTHPVALKQANPWGLYDMLGNVWEWLEDDWHNSYQQAPADGTAWSASLKENRSGRRVLRGGSWFSLAQYCRCAYRGRLVPVFVIEDTGFRCLQVQAAQVQDAVPALSAGARPAQQGEAHLTEHGTATRVAQFNLANNNSLLLSGKRIKNAARLLVRSDYEQLLLQRLTKPQWASAIGRDFYGLWVEITIHAVVQRLRWIPPGQFTMGSPEDEPGRWSAEGDQHQVILEKGYWLFDTPVTQALWQAVMGKNPSEFKSAERPVDSVSWNDCQKFIKKVNKDFKGLDLALPSEAQWEYACRAGTTTALYSGEIEILGEHNAPALDAIAWYGGNSGQKFELDNGYDSSDWKEKQYNDNKAGTHPVALKQVNPWGLYDMLGNVWEWAEDDWHNSYKNAPADGTAWSDSLKENKSSERVLRGGSWNGVARYCRCAFRNGVEPDFEVEFTGFRCLQQDQS